MAQRKYRKLDKDRLIVEAIFDSKFMGKPTSSWEVRDSNMKKLSTKSSSTNSYDTLILPYFGKFFVTYTITNPPFNCPSTYTDTVNYTKNTIGLTSIDFSKLKFYPNPIRTYEILSIDLLNSKDKFIIYDIKGAKLNIKQRIDGNQILISGFDAKGIYLIERLSFGRREYFKLIVN